MLAVPIGLGTSRVARSGSLPGASATRSSLASPSESGESASIGVSICTCTPPPLPHAATHAPIHAIPRIPTRTDENTTRAVPFTADSYNRMMGALAATVDLKLPSVFGRYLLLRRISRGGMGEVFLARSGQLSGFEKLCVIKKVLAHLSADREFIRRFIDEAQVAIKLQHANIAQVFEVGMVEGEYFLALEWIDGRDLRRTLARLIEKRTRMPVELGLLVMRDVVSGLAYAHRRTDDTGHAINLVHCDISPPNVLVAFEGGVKIIDFGIAKSAIRTAETNPKMGFGKYGYMAPEQLVQGGKVDRRTDVYAAGVLLYELLVGRRMFIFPEGADYRQMARIVAQGQHPRPSDIDPNL